MKIMSWVLALLIISMGFNLAECGREVNWLNGKYFDINSSDEVLEVNFEYIGNYPREIYLEWEEKEVNGAAYLYSCYVDKAISDYKEGKIVIYNCVACTNGKKRDFLIIRDNVTNEVIGRIRVNVKENAWIEREVIISGKPQVGEEMRVSIFMPCGGKVDYIEYSMNNESPKKIDISEWISERGTAKIKICLEQEGVMVILVHMGDGEIIRKEVPIAKKPKGV